MLEPGVEPTGTAETRDASISKRANEASVYERDQHSHRLSTRQRGCTAGAFGVLGFSVKEF